MSTGAFGKTVEASELGVIGLGGEESVPVSASPADQTERISLDRQPCLSTPAFVRSDHAEIRALGAADVPMVATLFKSIFRADIDVALPELEAYLKGLFLEGPDYDPACPSRVHVTADGRITGFIGSLVQPMALGTRQIRAAHATCLMVTDPKRDSLAGARLLRSFMTGAQDLSFSETSSPLSRRLWTRLGGRVAVPHSMKWLRIFRLTGAGITFASRRLPVLRVLHPVCALADRLTARFPGGAWLQLPASPSNATVIEVDRSEIAHVVEELVAGYALRPAWSSEHLAHRLAHAQHMPLFGPLVCCRVIDRHGGLIGGLLYHVRRDGLAVVLQVLARESTAEPVIACLFRDAYERGAVAVCGRTEPHILDGLLQAGCIIMQRGVTTVHSRDSDVLAAVTRQQAMLTGLAGESWSQLVGGLSGGAEQQVFATRS